MIAACETQDFVPFGREYIHQHPGKFQIQVQRSHHADHGLPLLRSFSDITISEKNKKEQWEFNAAAVDGMEEELYVSGNTVIWSRGSQQDAKKVLKTFTVESPVVQAKWYSFLLSYDVDKQEQTGLDLPGEVQHGICVLESTIASVFTTRGEEYNVALPFQVTNSWAIKNGLLFERTLSPTELTASKSWNAPNQTILFSMLHPLDDIVPVVTKTTASPSSSKIAFFTDSSQQIVFSSADPSIILIYDTMLGIHSVWKIRRTKAEECSSLAEMWDMSSLCTPFGGGQNLSGCSHSRATTLSSQSPGLSPLRNYSGRTYSPTTVSRSQSPALAHLTTAVSRSQSLSGVSSGSNLHRLCSPVLQARSSLTCLRSPPGSQNLSVFSETMNERVEPLTPEVCLEHAWNEPTPSVRDGHSGRASKAFVTKDMCNQFYLCYLVPVKQQLRCVKYEESNDQSQLIFGTITTISARDAIPIVSTFRSPGQATKHLPWSWKTFINMQRDLMVVLDVLGNLVVYSGVFEVNKLFVPTLPLGSSLNLHHQATPINSPRMGNLITSSRPPSAGDMRFDAEVSHISPVPSQLDDTHTMESPPSLGDCQFNFNDSVHAVRDNTGSHFTVETINGALYRTSLPALTKSPGIDVCLKALKQVLPKHISMPVLSRWYTTRNVAGEMVNRSEWSILTRCLFSLMGFDTGCLAVTKKHEFDNTSSPVVEAKRARPSNQGSEMDWKYLLNSEHHRYMSRNFDSTLFLSPCKDEVAETTCSKPCLINTTSLLFPYIPAILFSLHLVYEELKLNSCLADEVENLVQILFQLASDLQCHYFTDCYIRDFPHLFNTGDSMSQIQTDHWSKMQSPVWFSYQAPSVFNWICLSLRGLGCEPMPYIAGVCKNVQNIVTLYSILLDRGQNTESSCLKKISSAGHRASPIDNLMQQDDLVFSGSSSKAETIVLLMTKLGITKKDLELMPVGVALPLREAILYCRWNPPSDWPESAYILIGRQDLSQLSAAPDGKSEDVMSAKDCHPHGKTGKEEEDGMGQLDEELLKLRFSEDLRIQEVRRLLQSTRPVRVALVQRPEVSDHEFIEEQERYLYSICTRTMALPVGRGMFTLCTFHPLPTEALPIPKLCLTGKAPPRNTTVDLSHIETPPNMSTWPHFHNGVAAGLRIANSSQVNSTWIIYNKPKTCDLTTEYAGFLMALGLNGHLANLGLLDVHEYLSKGHDMTTIGVLLGLAAAKRGTMDLAINKVLSIHVPALLPPTSTELNISHNVQVAAVLGVGLVYQGTAHRHIAEVLLSEIGRPPGPEMENCTNRESYATAAGLALGLVMFGKGSEAVGLSDVGMADTLCHFMVGGHKRPLSGPNRERYRSPSYQIKEGDNVNVDVTSPGATLALGMLYFSTNNSAVADWLKAPDTQFTLDHVRPDFLMLRALCRGLVMWDHILPTTTWIESNLPQIVQNYGFRRGGQDEESVIDYETMSQAYCNIVAGACMAMGLKFAGTANASAYQTLLDCMKRCMCLLPVPPYCEQAGKSTVENCTVVVLLSLAMVMSGTGDLDVLRICRALRKRVGPQHSYAVYGSHMAVSMATGLLFLGGGRYSLSTKPEAIAAMLCAFFPKFPTHSSDNRYHLQAFRHLYVLAAEPRVIVPEDVDTRQLCYVPVEIHFKDTTFYQGVMYTTMAPCLLPDPHLLKEVKVTGPRYWPIQFHVDKNWKMLERLLKSNGIVYVKQKAGHLTYTEDPKGYRSQLAKSLTSNESSFESVKLHPEFIKSFTSDPQILAFFEYFLRGQQGEDYDALSSIVYSCAFKEKPEGIATQTTLLSYQTWHGSVNNMGLWQLKIVLNYLGSQFQIGDSVGRESQLVESEFVLSLKNRLEKILDSWEQDHMDILVRYLQGDSMKGYDHGHLSSFLVWYGVPHPCQLSDVVIKGTPTLPLLCSKLPQLGIPSVMKLLTAWRVKQQHDKHS